MNDCQRARRLYERGYAHEMEHDLEPARELLQEALRVATVGRCSEVIRSTHQVLGVVEHKADRLAEAERHLQWALRLALAAEDRTGEAYARQELGFLLLDQDDPVAAAVQFRRCLALAPGAGIVNLAGNALDGLGVALLDQARIEEAVPLLQAALAIRTEIGDLETQHVDLVHLARAALLVGERATAAAVARLLDGSCETAKGMYGHDRRALAAVLAAVSEIPTAAAASFDDARRLVATVVPTAAEEDQETLERRR